MANNRILLIISVVVICVFVLMAIGSVFHAPDPDEAAPDEPEEDEAEEESEDEQFYRPYDDVLSLNLMPSETHRKVAGLTEPGVTEPEYQDPVK